MPGGSPGAPRETTANKFSLGVAANMRIPGTHSQASRFDTQITGSEVNEWFIALDQQLSAAAMHLYLAYEHFDGDINLVTRDPNGKLKNVPVLIDDFDLVYSGGRIYF